jgi:hypothetical protein
MSIEPVINLLVQSNPYELVDSSIYVDHESMKHLCIAHLC